jgi:hypothetical protein
MPDELPVKIPNLLGVSYHRHSFAAECWQRRGRLSESPACVLTCGYTLDSEKICNNIYSVIYVCLGISVLFSNLTSAKLR